MFVVSMKASKKKIGIVLAAMIVVVAGCLLFVFRDSPDAAKAVGPTGEYGLTASDNAQRVAFLQQFGWKVKETPMEQVDVAIPSTFNDTYENYNLIQKEQGLDLSKFSGRTCQRYTYEVVNYPGKETGVIANLLVLEDRVIGGDICSVELNGFIHGFVNPNDTAAMTQVSPGGASSSEAAAPENETPSAAAAGEPGAEPADEATPPADETGTVPEENLEDPAQPAEGEAQFPVESSTERETLAPDPEMPNAPTD